MKFDFLIVGQGIAGTVLTDHLKSAGYQVMVIDEPALSNSSKVAGGLYNPITGRKMTKTWKADDLFDYVETYYEQLERSLGVSFLEKKSIYRPFVSIEELNEWMGKSADPLFNQYIEAVLDSPHPSGHLNDPHGGLLLKKCGYVDTSEMMHGMREMLIKDGKIKEEHFDQEALEVSEEGVAYKGLLADKIIFTDGQLLVKNSFFNWLPLRPVKGELLLIRVEEPIDVIYNRGVFVIPVGGGICKVGSTYDHHRLNNSITEEAKIELISRLKKLVKFRFEVVDQKAGIRPATKDRKPFIGIHPEQPRVGVFNGMGTKGISLAPFFAKQFVNSLTSSADLDPEVNISRFFSLY